MNFAFAARTICQNPAMWYCFTFFQSLSGSKLPDFTKGEHRLSRALKAAPLESLFTQFCLHSLWFGNCNIRGMCQQTMPHWPAIHHYRENELNCQLRNERNYLINILCCIFPLFSASHLQPLPFSGQSLSVKFDGVGKRHSRCRKCQLTVLLICPVV